MKNLNLVRIDDRLIHGQVMTAWVKFVKARRIIIVDDKVSRDDFMKTIIIMAAPSDVEVDIYTEEEADEELKKGLAVSTILLVKTPFVLNNLIKKGIKIETVNVGGMAMANNRTTLFKNIAASMDEREIFKNLIENGIDIKIQIVPSEKIYNIKNYLK